jgi:hypothetical protein
MNKGVNSHELCGACNGKLTSERVFQERFIIFVCGHGFHTRCISDHMCAVCMENNRKKGEFLFKVSSKRNNIKIRIDKPYKNERSL